MSVPLFFQFRRKIVLQRFDTQRNVFVLVPFDRYMQVDFLLLSRDFTLSPARFWGFKQVLIYQLIMISSACLKTLTISTRVAKTNRTETISL